MFCREGVTGLRRASESTTGYPTVLFVFRDEVKQGEDFFQYFWPGAKGIADPHGNLFDSFGLFGASWRKLMGIKALLAGWRAYRQGYRIGKPGKDVMRSPGLYVIQDKAIVWEHNFNHIGDHPNFKSIPF